MKIFRELIKKKCGFYDLDEVNEMLEEQKQSFQNGKNGLIKVYEEKLDEVRINAEEDIKDLMEMIEQIKTKDKELLLKNTQEYTNKLECNEEYYTDIIKSQNERFNTRFSEMKSQLSVLKTRLMFLNHKGKNINYETIINEIDRLIKHSETI